MPFPEGEIPDVPWLWPMLKNDLKVCRSPRCSTSGFKSRRQQFLKVKKQDRRGRHGNHARGPKNPRWASVGLMLMVVTLAACGQRHAGADTPEPSRQIGRGYFVGMNYVREFRDSAGRVCVLASYDQGVALDCGYPRDYNRESPE